MNKISEQSSQLINQNEQNIIGIHDNEEKEFIYQILYEINYEFLECQDFNFDCTLVVCTKSEGDFIIIFTLINGEYQQNQIINSSQSRTQKIFCSKQNNSFISTHNDYSMKIWYQSNQNKKWNYRYSLIGHKSNINWILISKKNDEIISSSNDETIIFWDCKGNNKLMVQYYNPIYQLDYNSDESLFISRIHGGFLIWKKDIQTNQWEIVQKVKLQFQGRCINFITDWLIACQEVKWSTFTITLYKKKCQEEKFEDISCYQYTFQEKFQPLSKFVYNHYNQILMAIDDKFILILKVNLQNNKLQFKQKIKFICQNSQGIISCCGQYLITQNIKKQTLQIMKYELCNNSQ